jgi:hypothetical protein
VAQEALRGAGTPSRNRRPRACSADAGWFAVHGIGLSHCAGLPPRTGSPESRKLAPGLPRGGHIKCGSASQLTRSLLAESEDGREGFVDAPLLVRADSAHQIAKPSGIDCADLLH